MQTKHKRVIHEPPKQSVPIFLDMLNECGDEIAEGEAIKDLAC